MVVPSIPLGPWEVAVVAGIALLICVTSTSMAVESTALFVPAFLVFFPAVLPRFPAVGVNEAIGLTLVVMVFGQTSANVGYWIRGQIDVPLAASVLVWTVPAAVLGRVASYLVPEPLLLSLFAGLLLALSLVVFRHGTADPAPAPTSANGGPADGSGHSGPAPSPNLRGRDRIAMGGGGGLTGLLGLGMGEVCNTVLTARGRLGVHRSIGTSTLVLYLTVLSATITNLVVLRYGGTIGAAPEIPWGIAAIIAPVVLVGGQIGPYLNSILPERVVLRVLVVLYLVVAGVTVIRALG